MNTETNKGIFSDKSTNRDDGRKNPRFPQCTAKARPQSSLQIFFKVCWVSALHVRQTARRKTSHFEKFTFVCCLIDNKFFTAKQCNELCYDSLLFTSDI